MSAQESVDNQDVVRSTAFIFTINNYTEQEIELVKRISNDIRVKKMIVGMEVGEQKTPHLQGYIQFHKRQYRSNVSKWLNGKAFLQAAKRSPQENYKYCTKQGNILVNKGFELLEKVNANIQRRQENKDQRALEILQDIYQYNESDFALKHAWFYLYKQKEYRMFKAQFDQSQLPNYEGVLSDKNYWIYGPAGSGKSRLADDWSSPEKIMRKTNNKWFDGYHTNLEFVIIDDITPNLHPETARTIKNLADRYKFIVEIKNGTKVISPNDYCLIITSNYTIEQVFPNVEDHKPIKRRFSIFDTSEVQKLGAVIDPPPFLEVLRRRRQEINELPIEEALKRIAEEKQLTDEDPIEQLSQSLNQIKSKSQKRHPRPERSPRSTQRSSTSTQLTQAPYNSDDDIPWPDNDAVPEHPVFQGKEALEAAKSAQIIRDVTQFSEDEEEEYDNPVTEVGYATGFTNHSQSPQNSSEEDEEEDSNDFSFSYDSE